MAARDASCRAAERFLEEGSEAEAEFLLEHLDRCGPCGDFFLRHQSAFEAIFDEALPGSRREAAILAHRMIAEGLPATGGGEHHPADREWEAPPVPGFERVRLIGETSASKVYLCGQNSLGRLVALKYARVGPGGESRRLAGEAALLAELNHPNIVTIHESGSWADGIWLALEHCPGGSLAERLEAPWAPDAAARLVSGLCSGLRAAHKRGIIHRDIKPGNILFTSDNQPKIADFGLAGRFAGSAGDEPDTVAGVIGTPSYIAPELAKGQPTGPGTDIYSLGAVLYHLLTGRPPFRGANAYESLMMAAHSVPAPPGTLRPSVPGDIGSVCMKCLEKSPEDRYRSARELAGDLTRFLEGRPVRARPIGPALSALRWLARNPLPATLLAAILLLAVAGSLAVSLFGIRANAEKLRALEIGALAERNLERAVQGEAEARTQSYLNKVQRALYEREHGSPAVAAELLESCPLDRRGWEHDYVHSASGRGQVILDRNRGRVHCVAVSPGDRMIASGDSTGRLALALAGAVLDPVILAASGPEVRGLAFSGDGRRLAAARADRTVEIWDLENRRQVRVVRSGSRLVRTWDGSLGQWKLTPAAGAATPGEFNWFGESVALDAAGGRLLCEIDDFQLGLWNLDTGLLEHRFPRKAGDPVRAVAWSRDLRRVAGSNNNGGILVQPAGGGPSRPWDRSGGPAVRSLDFSPDGSILASGGDDSRVRLWDCDNGNPLASLEGHTDWVNSVAFSPDGSLVASASDDYTIRVWSVADRRCRQVLRGHGHSVRSVQFTCNGACLVSGSWDGTVRLWRLDHAVDGPVDLAGPGGTDHVCRFAIFPDGDPSLLLTDSPDREVLLWDRSGGGVARRFKGHTERLQSVVSWDGGRHFATGSDDRTIRVWDLDRAGPPALLGGHQGNIQSLAYSRKHKRLLSACNDGMLGLWDPSGDLPPRFIKGSGGPLIALAVSPDQGTLAFAGEGSDIGILDLESLERRYFPSDHQGLVRCLAFSPDGKHLASGGQDGTIRLRDPNSGEPGPRLFGHTDGVTCLRFSPNGLRLFSSSYDKTIRVWSVPDAKEFLTLPGHPAAVRSIDLSADGRTLASCGDHGRVLLWEALDTLPTQSLDQAESIVLSAWRSADGLRIFGELNSVGTISWDPATGSVDSRPRAGELETCPMAPVNDDQKTDRIQVLGRRVWLVRPSLLESERATIQKRFNEWTRH